MTNALRNKTDKIFLSRGIDHLGDLGAKLRDLQGFKTLAHELVQNADDVPATTSMVFDVRDDALVVDNNGVFSDCHQVDNMECPWKADKTKGHRCDFHRFRYIAAGDKRGEEKTTGAFGFGFIAVYQITDSPEIISAGHHWILHEEKPESERIEVCPGCSKCNVPNLPGTRFILPWVFDSQSTLRKAFRADAISHNGPDDLLEELLKSLPDAMLFLKRLDSIEVKKNGEFRCKFERVVDGNNLIISQGNADTDQIWRLISGDFSEVAKTLRSKHSGQIEEKRSPEVLIAIPISTALSGVLCAFLPTEHKTNLPFHINADFFPTNDRKRVILDSDYQAKWNIAAIEATAQLLGSSIDLLPELLGPEGFWRFLKQVKDICDNEGDLFGKFWGNIKPQLKKADIIFTSTNKWVGSSDAVLLLKKEEETAIPILEEMGFNVVHENLRPYQNLLRSEAIGVDLFDISRMCQIFEKLGMVNRIEIKVCPSFFSHKNSRISIWQEINRLRASSRNPEEDIEQLKKISIAPGLDGAFWPGAQLFRADKATISLFHTINASIPFVAEDPEFTPLAKDLCSNFTVQNAIDCLKELGHDILVELWKENKIDLNRLFDWFKGHQKNILCDERIKSEFNSLYIFPSSGNLNKLKDLVIPGGFDDPLSLAKLVDLTAMEKYREFLIDLGMQKLDFRIYAKQQFPAALQNQDILPEKRRNAIVLLAERIGEVKDDEEVLNALRKTPLVECTDGKFHLPEICYFPTLIVRECLGKDIFLAEISGDSKQAIRDLYQWIGVADEPRYQEITIRVQSISQSPYSLENRQIIEKIVAHLGKRLDGEEVPSTLNPLKSLAWLPVKNRTALWYNPDEVYASYQAYLFESQALFLDIPLPIQNKSRKLFEFLEVKWNPTAELVVKHLIYCATNEIRVRPGVYTFLNNHTEDSALEQLKCEKCLYSGGSYFSPNQVFWGEHRFGRYRIQLDEDLRSFDKLLKRIGVRDSPAYGDALSVLREISEEFGLGNKPLDEETDNILLECWRILEKALLSEQISAEELQPLRNIKCIPNKQHLLIQAEFMFFENRTGLVEKFRGFLDNSVIPKPLDAGKAMAAAGVLPLGSAVKVQLLEAADPNENSDVKKRILNRRELIARILEGDNVCLQLKLLEEIKYVLVSSLNIKYLLNAFQQQLSSDPESVPSFYHKEEKQLLFKHHSGQVHWTEVSRELAVALFPDEDPGKMALLLKTVLAPDSDEDAESELDISGIARLNTNILRPSQSEPTVNSLGDETLPEDTSSGISDLGGNKDCAVENNEMASYQPPSKSREGNEVKDIKQKNNDTERPDYEEELKKSFNRPGETKLYEQAIDTGKVEHPDRYREKSYEGHKERLDHEPKPEERRRETMRTILEGPNEQVREYLSQFYDGKCQICGKTFPERNGKPFFIANYIVPKKLARFVDVSANALCLCADHFAKWQHGSVEADNIVDQIKKFNTESEGGDGEPSLKIKLCGEECIIKIKEKHILKLQELLRASENQNEAAL